MTIVSGNRQSTKHCISLQITGLQNIYGQNGFQTWSVGVVGYHVSLTLTRSPVRTRHRPAFYCCKNAECFGSFHTSIKAWWLGSASQKAYKVGKLKKLSVAGLA